MNRRGIVTFANINSTQAASSYTAAAAAATYPNALSSALEDPRFPPVRKRELPELEFEISVLGSFAACFRCRHDPE
jgi:AMMECR1 domain-containing protein